MNAVARYVARKPMPAAVVAGVGSVSGLAAIRSLARAGAPVIAVDHRRDALGFHSRHALAVRSPDPVSDPAGFATFLTGLGAALDRPAPIFPTDDEYLNAIAEGRDRIGESFLYPFPGLDVVRPILNKRVQLARAAEIGISVPRTAAAPTDELGFPALVQPSHPVGFERRFRRRSFLCETRTALDEAFERARPFGPLVEEYVPGGDEELCSLASYLAPDGEAAGLFCGRLRETSAGAWTRRVGEAIWVDEVVDRGLELLRGLRFHGLSRVEFKRDPRDGEFKLTDVNLRLWEWHGSVAACGVNLPRIAYWDLLGARLPPLRANGTARRRPFTRIASMQSTFGRLTSVDTVFAPGDPGPALVQAARLVRGRVR